MKKILLFLMLASLNLVAQTPVYEFNFNNSVQDNSGFNTFSILNANAPEYATDRFGNTNSALKVPNSNTNPYYQVDLSNIPQGNNPRTISVWVSYPIAYSNSEIRIFEYGNHITNQSFGLIQYGDTYNKIGAFGWANDAESSGLSSTYINNANAWYHYIMIYDGTNVKVYRNGNLIISSSKPSWNTTGINFKLNYASNYFGNSTNRTTTLFDDLKIYDTAFTDSQVKQIYANEVAFNNTGLIAYYGFENNLNCSNNTNLTLSVDNPSATPYQAGVIGNSRNIQNGPLYHNTLASLISKSEFTIMLWERQNLNDTEAYASVFEYGGSQYVRRRTDPNQLEIGYASDASNWNAQYTFKNPTSVWTHHAVTAKAVDGKIRLFYYKNGELWKEIPSSINATAIQTFNDMFVLGGGVSGTILASNKRIKNSDIDELYIYNRELSQSEILATMYRTTAPTFLATKETKKDNLISLIPNPARDDFSVVSKNQKVSNISVVDYLGRKILETQNKNINISKLPKGNYIVKIELQNGEVIVKKLMKK